MTGHPDYVVLRPAPCISEEEVPCEVFGIWLDLASIPQAIPGRGGPRAAPEEAIGAVTTLTPRGDEFRDYNAKPNNTFETNEFGLVAEVYLVHGAVHSCAQTCG